MSSSIDPTVIPFSRANEETPAKGEQRFRAIFEQAAVGVAQVAVDGRWMDVNARLCTFLGYSREELTATTFQAITHPDDLGADLDHARRLLAGEISTYAMEKRYRRKDGVFVWANLTVSLVRERREGEEGGRGRARYFICLVEDIGARKRAEAALREQRELLLLFVAHTPAAVAMFDRDMRYVAASDRWVRDFRLKDGAIIGRHYYEDFPEMPETWKAAHRRGLAGATEHSEGEPFPRADGTIDWVRWEMCPWYRQDEEKDTVGGIVIFTEVITDRKRIEASLADAAAHIELMVRASNIGLWDWDLRTNKVRYSREWKSQLGYQVDEISDDYVEWERRVHAEDLAPTLGRVRAYLADPREPYEAEFRMRHKDGSWRWIYARGELLRDGAGRASRMLGCHLDITERKRAADLARIAAEREATATIAAGVAHEFNSLLYAASLQIQRRAPGGRGPKGAPTAKAMEALGQARVLAAALLDLYAGPEKGRAVAHSLYPWLPETVSRLAASLPPGVRVSTEVAHDLPEVMAHPLGLEQVVRNLLMNAADATNGEGTIRVSAVHATVDGRAMVEIRVRDDGPGIPESLRARIFEPGFSTGNRSYHSGLGLAIAKRLLEQFGGSIAYEPGAPTGSIFTIRLGVRPEYAS